MNLVAPSNESALFSQYHMEGSGTMAAPDLQFHFLQFQLPGPIVI